MQLKPKIRPELAQQSIREKATKRVSCPAFYNMIRAESVIDEADQISLLSVMADLVDDEEEDSDT